MKHQKVFNVAIASAVAASGIVAVAPVQAEMLFSDVDETSTHFDAIMELAEREVISGYGDGTFAPNKAVTRGQAAKIIAGLLELDTENVMDPEFSDVPTSHQYYGAIAALYEADIISGYEDGSFGPSKTLTRGQMAKIIALAFELEGTAELPFTDIPEDSDYTPYIEALYANEVTTGTTETTYSPSNKVTRGQLASFVIRAEDAVEAADMEQNEEQVIDATIATVEDGKVTIGETQYEVAPELAGVFSAENAAALADADVQLVVEYTTEPVASLAPVAMKKKGKIIGLKKMKLVKENTVFNAKGYEVPELIVAAKNVTVKQIITAILTVLENATVKLEKSKVVKVETAVKDAVTVDEESKVEQTIVVEVTPEKVPSTGGLQIVESQTALDKVVAASVEKMNAKTDDVVITFSPTTNVIEVTVVEDGTTIAEIRKELRDSSKGLTLEKAIAELSLSEAASIVATVTELTVVAGAYSQTKQVEDYVDSKLDVDRDAVVDDVDLFIDEAIKKSGKTVLNLKDVKATFANSIAITAGAETYTVVVK